MHRAQVSRTAQDVLLLAPWNGTQTACDYLASKPDPKETQDMHQRPEKRQAVQHKHPYSVKMVVILINCLSAVEEITKKQQNTAI